MIRIHKPATAPDGLASVGANRRTSLCQRFTRSKVDYCSGKKLFSFDGTVYGSEAVKEALNRAQHNKCCFCETRISEAGDREGDVEHYRPKAGVHQTKGDPMERPGYYWLAYEWDNLLYACKACNQMHKGNQFPLADPTRRARSHHDNLNDEVPLLIHPANEEPSDYLGFRQEFVFAVKGQDKGSHTIAVCGLNRPLLRTRRHEQIERVQYLCQIIRQRETLLLTPEGKDTLAKAQTWLRQAALDSAEFAAAVRASLPSDFHELISAGE